MSSASVGFHCPECATPSPAQQRASRMLRSTEPRLTYALIAINVAVFALDLVAGDRLRGDYPSFVDRFGLLVGVEGRSGTGVLEGMTFSGFGVADGEWWRIVTSGFLHASLLHIAFNMYALYILGPVLERTLGRARFGAIYLVSLLGGSLGAVLMSQPGSVTIGASGAIFGLFGAFVFLQLSRGMNPMDGGIGPIILLNLLFTFLVPNISVGGHLGGLIAGGLAGWVLVGRTAQEARARDGRSRELSAAVYGSCVVLAVLTVVAAGWVSTNGPVFG